MKAVNTITHYVATRRAFSILASKIHPQLPLSPRESQQLLNLLTTSFRRQLDQEHPLGADKVDSPTKPQNNKGAEPLVPSQLSAQGLTIRHIEHVLDNPLLATRPKLIESGYDGLKLGDIEYARKDPLAWFKDEIAAGTADIRKALACLYFTKGHDKPLTDSKGRGPGLVVAQWLTDSRQSFLSQHFLLNVLSRQLVREDRDYVLWTWFRHPDRLQRDDSEAGAKAAALFRSRLLWAMVNARAAHDNSLDEAVRRFLSATAMIEDTSTTVKMADVIPAGKTLSLKILQEPKDTLTAERYESFLKALSTVALGWMQLFPALLRLEHPRWRDAAPGYLYLRGYDAPAIPESYRPRLMQLALGVAQALLSEGRHRDSQWVMGYLKKNFPRLHSLEPAGAEETNQINEFTGSPGEMKIAENEHQSLQLSDRLSIA